MIGHIEKNQCKFIKNEDFQKHKAEIQLEKEAVSERFNVVPDQLDVISQNHSDPDYLGGISLADDERVHHPESWNSSVNQATDVHNEPQYSTDSAVSQWDTENYPPLVAEKTASNVNRRQYTVEQDSDDVADGSTSDLLGSKYVPKRENTAWSTQAPSKTSSIPSRQRQQGVSSGNLLDSMVDDDRSTATSAATRGTRSTELAGRSEILPPAAQVENQDPNAPYAQVQVGQKMSLPPKYNLEQYWSSFLGVYECPGYNCGLKLRSAKDFESHLLSGAHAGARIKCPCCFKNFKSTQALVAHAESGSKRCDLRNTEDFDLAIREITGGLLKIGGYWEGHGNARFESVPVEEWKNVSW